MPVGINSPARNLFLLGSSGQAAVTNFFETIDQSAGTDGVYLPAEIKYIFSNQKYALAGSAQDSNAVGFGWFERQDYDLETGVLTTDYTNEVVNTQSLPTTLFAMELDANENLIVGGITGDVPWIAKYSNDGVLDWQSTTNSADVEYSGIASNSSGNYYACGSTQSANPQQAFVEKFDANGNPGWGKSAFMLGRHVMLDAIDANSRGQVVAVGHLEDDSYIKGYIVKIDTNTGEVLWDRTLDAGGDITLGDVFIDNNDQIYIVGTSLDPDVEDYKFKYTTKGNLILHRKTNGSSLDNFTFDRVKSDGETEQTIVFGTYFDMNGNDLGGVLSKYAKDGSLVWRRTIFSSNNNSDSFSNVCLDADPSFYYLLYVDTEIDGLAGTPDSYTFGQVSSSGNGLGGFQYAEGTGETIDYQILNIGDTISRVSDGSVRNDSSDLITYPFTGNKIVFDDLSTQVTNKKRQMDSGDSFEYSGSPAIRPTDFQELNLLGDAEFVEGPNLITNGTFDNDINGWDGTGISLLHNSFTTSWNSNGYLEVNSNTNSFSYYGISQDVPTVNGKVYKISIDVVSGSVTSGAMRVQDGNSGVNPLPTQTSLGVGTHEFYFTAGTQGFSKVFLGRAANLNGANNVAVLYDNIKVCEVSVVDQSGKGNDGVVSGAIRNAAGYWEFDGVDDNIEIGTLSYDYSQLITLEAWIRTTDSGAWNQIVCGESGDILWAVNSGKLNFGSQTNTPIPHDNRSTAIINTGDWVHVATTYDGAEIKHYINGELDSTFAETGSLNANEGTHPLRIGARGTGTGELYGGDIGEVRIYPRALTAAAVFQNYNATKSKYINEAPDTAPKIGPGIVYGSNLLLNYDFGNRATYDSAENLLESSEDFSSTYWVIQNCNVTDAPDQISPGGTKNVKKLAVNDGTNLQVRLKNFTSYGVGTYTSSIYAKAGEKTGLTLFFDSTDVDPNYSGSGSYYNLLTGQVTSNADAAGMEDVGGGWWRCWATNDTTSSGNTHPLCVVPQGDSYVSVNTQSNNGVDGIYIWGAQVVENDTLSRYIRTFESAITPPTAVTNLSNSYLTAINGATFNSAGYFDFDGTDDYINLTASVAPLADTSAVTMEAWVNVDNLTNTYQCIGTWERTTNHWQLTYSGDTNYNLNLSVSGSNDSAGTTSAPATGSWQHVVATWNGGSLSTLSDWAIYVNGVAQTIQLTGSTGTGGNDSYIGTRQGLDASNMLDGKMGEIRYYNRALTSTEVSQNFNATRAKYGV